MYEFLEGQVAKCTTGRNNRKEAQWTFSRTDKLPIEQWGQQSRTCRHIETVVLVMAKGNETQPAMFTSQ